MDTLADGRSHFNFFRSLFTPKATVSSPAPRPAPYAPFDGLSMMDIRSLRRTLLSAAHNTHPDDEHVLYEKVNPSVYEDLENVDRNLGEIARTKNSLFRHPFMGSFEFGAGVYRCRLTGEFGLMVFQDVNEVSLEVLHGLPQYKRLCEAMEIPTSLGRSFSDEVNIVDYYVRCFLTVERLSTFEDVAVLLREINKSLKGK